MALKHAGCYAFWYQQEDRFRHEEIPDIKRLQYREYEEAVSEYSSSGCWNLAKVEGSTFNPDAPWNHVFHLAVKSTEARYWWSENYLWQASQVVLKIKTLKQFLENGAPIAASVAEHAITAYVPTQAARAPYPKMPIGGLPTRPPTPWEKKRKEPQGGKPSSKGQPGGKPKTKDSTGRHTICHSFNTGRCTDTSSGACGPNSCAKRPQFIHACNSCGEVGHASTSCPQGPVEGGHGNTKDKSNKRRKKGGGKN
jgi:hypothetical protein